MKNISVTLRLSIATVDYEMIADIEQTFNRQVQIPFGSTSNKRVIKKALKSINNNNITRLNSIWKLLFIVPSSEIIDPPE